MKSIQLSEGIEKSQIENEIENLINLRHPCIASPIGFVVPIESGSPQKLTIVRLYLEGCSLWEVLSVNPAWWTSTVKAKVVAGIVLGLRFAHSLGLVHGCLTANNILFDFDHCVQIVDFNLCRLAIRHRESEEKAHLGSFSGEGWAPEKDIQAFASILFEIVFGRPAKGEISVPASIPAFISRIIESGFSPISRTSYSFNTILEILKQNDLDRKSVV
jgi:serine/threonine protein kinase